MSVGQHSIPGSPPRAIGTGSAAESVQSPHAPFSGSAIQLLLEYLKGEGIDTVFGIPGGPITPLFDALYYEKSVKTISTRHECGAAFMAAGYARVTGRLGTCIFTTGPGTINAMTAVAAAKADSLPMLVISAQVPTLVFGKGSLQESTYDRSDVVEMMRPITKMSAMLANPGNMGMMLRQCIRIAMTGKRGPVHLNIPTDLMRPAVKEIQQIPMEYRSISHTFDREAVKQASEILLHSAFPAILAGHGVNMASAQPELKELAELLSIPVATTPKGKGAFPENHPLSLRVFGAAGSPRADHYLLSGKVDVLFVIGSGMHEMSTQGWDERLRPTTALLQQDIDPSIVARNYPVQVALIGDSKTTLREMIFHIRRLLKSEEFFLPARSQAFDELLHGAPAFNAPESMDSTALPMKPQRLMRELNQSLPEDAIVFIDSGNHTFWSIHYLNANGRNVFVHNCGEFGAMGFGVAAAIGGKLGAEKRPIFAIVGDGAFGMLGMEINTAATYDIPVVWIVLNDARFNAVYHGQQLQYGGRTIGTEFQRMDIERIAEGLGARGRRITNPLEIRPALAEAVASGKPTVLDVIIDGDEVPPIHARVKALERFFAGKS